MQNKRSNRKRKKTDRDKNKKQLGRDRQMNKNLKQRELRK